MMQLWDAVRYVRDALCMPQAAATLPEELERAVASLSGKPNRFRSSGVEPLFSAGVRRMNVRGCPLFYRVDEASSTVDVIGGYYGTPSYGLLRRVFQDGMGDGR